MKDERIWAIQSVEQPIADELQRPVHVIALGRTAKRPNGSGEDIPPESRIAKIRVLENLGNIVVNKQVGKCPAKNDIGG